MGRHARGAARSRVPVAVVVWTVVVLIVLGAGALLGDRGRVADSQDPVTASAVVVSSLACSDGTGTTLVDVLDPASPLSAGLVRATLDACGYQEGQQLSVQFASTDPARVVLAGTAPAAGAGLLPLGVAIAALLALGAGLAVWIDSRRRPRHRAVGTARHLMDHETIDTAGDPAADPEPEPVVESASARPAGAGDRPDEEAGDRVAALAVAGRRRAGVELNFPFSSTLAASLHDELFTHRSVSS
ncbi:hypothetical protein ACVBEQ_24610 [Nakamurella sp. GG22]